MFIPLLLLAVSIVAIYLGARWLVEGASELAGHFGVPPLVIGLTIVAFGTSLPEFALGVVSGIGGAGSLSVGNIIGSNIANATLIIGACAVIAPIIVKFEEIRREAIFMLLALMTLTLFSFDGQINTIEGLVMIVLFITYLALLVRSLYCCRPRKEVVEEFNASRPEVERPLKSFLFLAVGAIVLILGSEGAVNSATTIASIFGISEFIIGLTIVTIGTVTPEFATSLIAASKGRADIAVGTTIGTLVFNTSVVIGTGAVITPLSISGSQILLGVLPSLFFGALLAGIAYKRESIGKREGSALIALYILYLAALLLLT